MRSAATVRGGRSVESALAGQALPGVPPQPTGPLRPGRPRGQQSPSLRYGAVVPWPDRRAGPGSTAEASPGSRGMRSRTRPAAQRGLLDCGTASDRSELLREPRCAYREADAALPCLTVPRHGRRPVEKRSFATRTKDRNPRKHPQAWSSGCCAVGGWLLKPGGAGLPARYGRSQRSSGLLRVMGREADTLQT